MELIGSLGAAFLGALVGVIGQALWTRHKEKLAAADRRKSAALLIRGELQQAALAIGHARDSKSPMALSFLSIRSWELHAWELTTLPTEDFDRVLDAYAKVDGLIQAARQNQDMIRAQGVDPGFGEQPGFPVLMGAVLGKVEDAIQHLGPVAYPTIHDAGAALASEAPPV